MKRIAIIGAGFSGILLCYHLIAKAKKPFHLTIIEQGETFARGTAYKTTSPAHYLNVKAGNMSALPKDPSHFMRWLQNDNKDLYHPRREYGHYLQSIWEEANRMANGPIDAIQKEVCAISYDRAFTLTFSDGTTTQADVAILACGVPDNKFFIAPHKHYTQNIWKPEPYSLLQKRDLSDLPTSAHIAIIGSGLTMLDALASLEEKQYKGKISVISNDGKLPERHIELPSNPPQFFSSYSPKSARDLIHLINQARKKAKKMGYDWRHVVDELRPHIQKIWQDLPTVQKKKLLPLLSLWNRHRHRMPEPYVKLVERVPFDHLAGTIQRIDPHENAFSIFFDGKKLEADYIFNCSGPEMNPDKSRSPLLQNLLSSQLLLPDDLHLGAAVDKHQSLIGKAQNAFFVLGQLLFGTKLEITAVPELRESSEQLAIYLANEVL